MASAPVKKRAPSAEMLSWVQKKYIMLGGAQLVMKLITHPEDGVVGATLLYGCALLQGGNVQAEFLDALEQDPAQSAKVFTKFKAVLGSVQSLLDERGRVASAIIMQNQHNLLDELIVLSNAVARTCHNP